MSDEDQEVFTAAQLRILDLSWMVPLREVDFALFGSATEEELTPAGLGLAKEMYQLVHRPTGRPSTQSPTSWM